MATYLGMNIIYHNRRVDETVPYSRVELNELYARSDLVLLLCPLTPQTRGMINREAFAKMKDQVILVNVGRGKVVVEQDLVDALDSGKGGLRDSSEQCECTWYADKSPSRRARCVRG